MPREGGGLTPSLKQLLDAGRLKITRRPTSEVPGEAGRRVSPDSLFLGSLTLPRTAFLQMLYVISIALVKCARLRLEPGLPDRQAFPSSRLRGLPNVGATSSRTLAGLPEGVCKGADALGRLLKGTLPAGARGRPLQGQSQERA